MCSPWLDVEQGITQEDIERHAYICCAAVGDVQAYIAEYVRVFRQGPDVFVPWYLSVWNADGVGRIEPLYPHEVFPVLLEMDVDWLYGHPAWTGAYHTQAAPLRPLVEWR